MSKFSQSMRVKPTGRDDRYKKLKTLKCYREVYDRLCAGWPMTELARFIQEERKEYTDVKRGNLEDLLRDFRKTVPATDLVAKRFPEVYDQAVEELENSLDEVAELEELYRIQMHRIKIDFKTETKINKLMPSMTSEIREARQLLESLAQVKMDLGVNSRAPTQHNVNVEGSVEARLEADLGDNYTGAVKKVMENAESRRRVQGLVDRFMKIGDRTALPSLTGSDSDDSDSEDEDE